MSIVTSCMSIITSCMSVLIALSLLFIFTFVFTILIYIIFVDFSVLLSIFLYIVLLLGLIEGKLLHDNVLIQLVAYSLCLLHVGLGKVVGSEEQSDGEQYHNDCDAE